MDGVVSLGCGSKEIATQAYVLMLVSLNDSWKMSLGYFLINGITAEQSANIIKTCLKKCATVEIDVVCLTFDGCTSNLATANILGCNLDEPADLKTTFTHPSTGQPVAIILYPCHMVKLIRDTLESKQQLIDHTGQSVQWRYIEELKKVQDNLGLHFANKLNERHLKFRNNMSVKLATQLLSNSVAKAIQLCEEVLNIPEFNDSAATFNFIKIMNDLFEVLNAFARF
ncbi:jg13426 [Pararge aegeria aegeria]|uniref:Jg13426 protein n=1 Tax=Pararge aegeria aegeria TaxID=348720 RepID=A0A8S4RWZ4_9NEOP|nr:jg13426 [Pararge aegeria aegeria]